MIELNTWQFFVIWIVGNLSSVAVGWFLRGWYDTEQRKTSAEIDRNNDKW